MTARKSIFITGGASGIGRAVAQHFAARGWFVGLADVNARGMAETAALLPSGQSSIHQLDVRKRSEWAEALAAFWPLAGERLDVLFNNAGVGRGGPLADMVADDVDATIDINLKGVIHGAEAGLPYLRKTPGSCLLNTASLAAVVGTANMSIYCATKFGVRGFTEALDLEWDALGIRVRSLMPGFIETAILEGPIAHSNRTVRDAVNDAGLEISPVSVAAEAAWDAVHGDAVHVRVGPSAKRMWHLQRLFPGFLRRQMKSRARGLQ